MVSQTTCFPGFSLKKSPKIRVVEEEERADWLLPWSGRRGREQRVAEVLYTGSSLGGLLPPWTVYGGP